MTAPIDPAKDFTDDDLQGLARRVANYAVESAEAHNRAAVYSSSLFRESIFNEALQMLRTAVMHERQRAGRDIDSLKPTHWN
ncbi:hypothetical protein [Hyphomicrobium sp.]|uniref:hypothetical protein n=1 Tax=Hyphomicrobium sp. TaxID=82 RepID=UPI002FE15B0D